MKNTTRSYAPALLNFAVIVLVALQTVELSWASIAQLAVLVLSAIGTFLVPLLASPWAGRAKTGVAILGAALAYLVPFLITGGAIDRTQVIGAVLAALAPLAVELGVQIRAGGTPVLTTKDGEHEAVKIGEVTGYSSSTLPTEEEIRNA